MTNPLPAIKRFTKPLTRTLGLLDTVIHEVGHTVVTLPLGSTLSIRINADGSGATHGTLGLAEGTLFSFPVRVINLLAGYAAPILLGVFLIISGFSPVVNVSGWWAFALPAFLLSALFLTVGLGVLCAIGLIAGWVAVVLSLTPLPSPLGETPLTGVTVAGWLLTYIGVVLLLSIRSLFTVLITALWFTVVGAVFLPPWDATPVLVVILGVLFLITGLWTVMKVAGSLTDPNAGSDFNILNEEFRGHPVGWFVLFMLFLMGMLTLLLFVWF